MVNACSTPAKVKSDAVIVISMSAEYGALAIVKHNEKMGFA